MAIIGEPCSRCVENKVQLNNKIMITEKIQETIQGSQAVVQ